MSQKNDNIMIHESAIVDEGCEVGSGSKIWHFCHLITGCKIGEGCSLGQNVMVAKGVVLGNNVKVQNNVSLYEGVVCEDDVFIGPSAVFTNVINPRSAISRKNAYKKTIVRKGVTIGANATIVCGVEIGAFAFVGAGAVVTSNVQPYSLVLGTPARHSGWMSEYGHRLRFKPDGLAECPESGDIYIFSGGKVVKIVAKDDTSS
ncbi:acyltransferase [Alkalitalea saponilacus]|uniref:UDP-2-acetamido-3-amino-2,3-dideoxy-glucuronate N-acetyltransferase n=1 Tax=Alkalitalea saponilacus TaxID=889453 RepID=A0A1T5HSU9_9BACT|nr:acyltransferase [Alkalitalea saponilacus]SKC23692.1 UDP-2-acetamido-3-amino-2,3-dideoxy-glucuronate N-acetyltransferase [Alkalitalea saponilacus]